MFVAVYLSLLPRANASPFPPTPTPPSRHRAPGDVPIALQGAQVMELDLGSLSAGCVMPGEFEERLKALVNEIIAAPRKTLLFIGASARARAALPRAARCCCCCCCCCCFCLLACLLRMWLDCRCSAPPARALPRVLLPPLFCGLAAAASRRLLAH